MFGFFKSKITKIFTAVTTRFSKLFSTNQFDEAAVKELTDILLSADTGVKATELIIKKLQDQNPSDIKSALNTILVQMLNGQVVRTDVPKILILVGINGSGKTTFISKYAHLLKSQGKRVLVVAADTFRAAATEQLAHWAKSIGVDLVEGGANQDPASVVFDGCKRFVAGGYDHLIIDTAGRLQTKVNLMKELEKIVKIIARHLPDETIDVWLTIDSMLGQNVVSQVELFHEAAKLTGLILTKMDGTGKGGIVFALAQKFNVPVVYMTFGEAVDDIKRFDATEYVSGLLDG